MVIHTAPAESPGLRVGHLPERISGSLPVVLQVQPKMSADRPEFESWSQFCFHQSGLSFPICKVGLSAPYPCPEAVSRTQGGRGQLKVLDVTVTVKQFSGLVAWGQPVSTGQAGI